MEWLASETLRRILLVIALILLLITIWKMKR